MKDEGRRTQDERETVGGGPGRATGAQPGPLTPDQDSSYFVLRTSYFVYLAYASNLRLRSANAVQTFNTARELRALAPGFTFLAPRFAWRESAFAAVGARHLLRLPFNALSHLWRTSGWSYLERSWFAVRAAVYLARRREPGRVVYVRDAVCAAWFGAGLARLVGARLIYEIHDLEQWNPSRLRAGLGRPLVRLIDRLAIRRADGVVTLTAAFRDYLDRVGLQAAERMAVIPDAYDDARYAPRDRAAARAATAVPAGAFVVTYAGLTFAYRRLDVLVRAFAALHRDRPESLLVLVGGREGERAELAALARDLGVADAVRLPGQLDQGAIPDYLAAADALTVPGTVSGLNASPLKLFEYAAMARPIVAVDIPAIREILGDDGASYVPAGDEAVLHAALAALADDRALAATLAARARERVAPFTYRARAAAMLDFAARLRG